eukprot:1138506-Pelagomonas_calceolata.AAC.11
MVRRGWVNTPVTSYGCALTGKLKAWGPYKAPPFQGLSSSKVIYTPHTSEPKELGLETHKATKLALKLHPRFVQYAFRLVSTRCALGKASFNSTTRSCAGYC